MQICPNCGAENVADAVQCVACQQPLMAPVGAVQGPAAGAAAYPGAPESSLYGAKGYQLGPQLDQQRAAPRLRPGDQLGHDRYRIKRIVALGGMGAVYEADAPAPSKRCSTPSPRIKIASR
jgi:hypothetical protein